MYHFKNEIITEHIFGTLSIAVHQITKKVFFHPTLTNV